MAFSGAELGRLGQGALCRMYKFIARRGQQSQSAGWKIAPGRGQPRSIVAERARLTTWPRTGRTILHRPLEDNRL
jgi:hypothetical protein